MPTANGPYILRSQHNGANFRLSFRRAEATTYHALSVLTLETERVICGDAQSEGVVLRFLSWAMTIQRDTEKNENRINAFAASTLHPKPICALVLPGIPDTFVGTLFDSVMRTGTLALQIVARDTKGAPVRFSTTIPPERFVLHDHSGYLQALIYATQTHRN